MIEAKQVGQEQKVERAAAPKDQARDKREREKTAKERDEYNLPFTD